MLNSLDLTGTHTPPSGAGSSNRNNNSSSANAKVPYLPVPEDSARVNSACPICQERFEMKWLDEAQEWVWTDAVRVGGRVFHASCHREAAMPASASSQGLGGGGGAVLGKRKAEVCFWFPLVFGCVFRGVSSEDAMVLVIRRFLCMWWAGALS